MLNVGKYTIDGSLDPIGMYIMYVQFLQKYPGSSWC